MVRTAPNMDFTIDDLSTYLPVRYPFYNFTSGTYGPLQKSTRWISNIGSNNVRLKYACACACVCGCRACNDCNTCEQVPDAVMSDMAAFYTPGWGFIDPFYKSDAAGMYPNSGNYGIEYHIEVRSTAHVRACVTFAWLSRTHHRTHHRTRTHYRTRTIRARSRMWAPRRAM
jgi:hypothetical protein